MLLSEQIIRALVYTGCAEECTVVEKTDEESVKEFLQRMVACPLYALESHGVLYDGKYLMMWTDDSVEYQDGLCYPAGCDQHLERVTWTYRLNWHTHDGDRDHYHMLYFYRMED